VVVDGGGTSVVDVVVVVLELVLVVNIVVVGQCDWLQRNGSTTISRP
jgi:hypothetical protein